MDDFEIFLEFRDSNWHAYWDKSTSNLKDQQILTVWSIYDDSVVGEFSYKILKNNINDPNFIKEIKKLDTRINDKDVNDVLCSGRIFLKMVDDKFQ